MECIGPLLSIYSAHTLMMQRLQESPGELQLCHEIPALQGGRADSTTGQASAKLGATESRAIDSPRRPERTEPHRSWSGHRGGEAKDFSLKFRETAPVATSRLSLDKPTRMATRTILERSVKRTPRDQRPRMPAKMPLLSGTGSCQELEAMVADLEKKCLERKVIAAS